HGVLIRSHGCVAYAGQASHSMGDGIEAWSGGIQNSQPGLQVHGIQPSGTALGRRPLSISRPHVEYTPVLELDPALVAGGAVVEPAAPPPPPVAFGAASELQPSARALPSSSVATG